MIDLEPDLREMFRRREGDVRPVLASPPRIGSRVRWRRARRGLLAGLLASAVAVASVTGVRSLTGPRYVPGVSEEGTRTVELDVFEITYPADWFLTGVAIAPMEDPSWRIVLSNVDLGEPAPDPCSTSLPSHAVMLVFVIGTGPAEGPGWPVELAPAPEPCGATHLVAAWSRDRYASSYRAEVIAGSGASRSDVDAARRAFRTLRFPDESGAGILPYPEIDRDVSFAVLAGGRIDEEPWLLGADRSEANGFHVHVSTRDGGSGIGSMRTGSRTDVYLDPAVFGGNMYLWGAVQPGIARVEVRPEGADPFDPDMIRLPSFLGSDLRAFVAPMTGAPSGAIALYDGTGALVREVPFAPGAVLTPERDRDRPVAGAIADGRFFGTSWVLRPDGGEVLVLETADGDELARTGERGAELPPDALVLTTYAFEGDGPTQTIVFGHGGREVAFVVLVGDGGLPSTTEVIRPTDGRDPSFWGNAGARPEFAVAYDASCAFLRAIDLRTLEEAPEPEIAGSPCG